MASSNQLEIISRGSVEVVSKQPEAASLTTHSADVNIDQHVALEPLPPEEPRYCEQFSRREAHYSPDDEQCLEAEEDSSVIPLCLETATHELAQSREQTASLLQRIEELSSRIRSGLTLVESTGTTVPSLLPTTELINSCDDGDSPNNDVNMTSLGDASHVEPGREEGKFLPSVSDEADLEGVKEGEEDSSVAGEVDPKLVKALEKMRRLDKKLADLVIREKEVKEQRRELEIQIMGEDHAHSPDSTSDGVPPVFPTQLSEEQEVGMSVTLNEAERQRLEQLLAQDEDNFSWEEVNAQSNAYRLTDAAQSALRHIDNQLQALTGGVLCGTDPDLSSGPSQSPPTTAAAGAVDELQANRLREINEQLAVLKNHAVGPEV